MPVPDPANPLTRDRAQGVVAGVCAGLAQWLGWDTTVVRILFALIALATGIFPMLVVYLVLWVVMPPIETPGP